MEKFSAEVLKLKCKQYKLVPIGKKAQLIERLVEHFSKNNQAHMNDERDVVMGERSGQSTDIQDAQSEEEDLLPV